jgi:hypothetical protein
VPQRDSDSVKNCAFCRVAGAAGALRVIVPA